MRTAPLARLAAALALVGLTAGCFLVVPVPLGQTPLPPAAPQEATPDSCGAAGLRGLVGQPESALAALRLPQATRIIHPGQPVTMDYSAARLNILIDSKGRVASLHCG